LIARIALEKRFGPIIGNAVLAIHHF
jgi:hypothetical protein